MRLQNCPDHKEAPASGILNAALVTGVLRLLQEQGVSWPLGQHTDSSNDVGKLGTPLKLLHGISESSHLEEFASWRLFGLEFRVKDRPQSRLWIFMQHHFRAWFTTCQE